MKMLRRRGEKGKKKCTRSVALHTLYLGMSPMGMGEDIVQESASSVLNHSG